MCLSRTNVTLAHVIILVEDDAQTVVTAWTVETNFSLVLTFAASEPWLADAVCLVVTRKAGATVLAHVGMARINCRIQKKLCYKKTTIRVNHFRRRYEQGK